jgi:hypothetical protein
MLLNVTSMTRLKPPYGVKSGAQTQLSKQTSRASAETFAGRLRSLRQRGPTITSFQPPPNTPTYSDCSVFLNRINIARNTEIFVTMIALMRIVLVIIEYLLFSGN